MSQKRWWAPVAATALVAALFAPGSWSSAAPAAGGEPVSDPIPQDPVQSGLGLVLEEYHQFPKTEPVPAPTDKRLMRHARINYIGEVPDGSGRQYVPDLNGPLYLLDEGAAQRVPRREGAVPGLLLRPRHGQRVRVRHLRPGVRGERQVLHRAHRAVRCDRHQAHDVPRAAQHVPARRGDRVDGVRPVGEHLQRHPPRDPAARLRRPRSTASSRSTSTRPRSRGTRTTACCTSPSGDGGIGLNTDIPQELTNPYGKILRIDPDGTNGPNGEYGVPSSQPVRRRGRRGRRDLRARHARPAPVLAGTRAASTGCSSATSASTRSRRSTRSGPVTTSAGASARAGSSTTRPTSATSTRCPPTTPRTVSSTRSRPSTTTRRRATPAARTAATASAAAQVYRGNLPGLRREVRLR